MFPPEQKIAPDLLLRSLRDEKDVSRFAAVLTKQLNVVEGLTANGLLRFHPERRLDAFQIVENTATGEVVSTSCIHIIAVLQAVNGPTPTLQGLFPAFGLLVTVSLITLSVQIWRSAASQQH